MSIPINPLSEYHTYSYHHVFIACDTTETAEVLSKSNEFLDFLRTGEEVNTPSDPYGKYRPRDVNLSKGRKGHYSIIINGTSDASFAITKANWVNITASPTDRDNVFCSYALQGGMTVQEPRGVDFMNVMAHVADFLESNPSGLIFMIKTIFIGHRSQTITSTGYVDPITYIRPLMFVITDISASFTIEGGVYEIEFMGISNGATKTRHIMKGADRVQINLSTTTPGCETNTLMGGLCKLQKRINEIYKAYFKSVKEKIESTTDKSGKKLKFNGREVVYIIQAEPPYAKVISGSYNEPETLVLQGNADYKVDQFKDQATDKGEKDEGGIVHFGSQPSIEGAIMYLAKRCSKVQKDLNEGENGTKYYPKVTSTIISNNKKYYVVYKLRRVLEARNDVVEQILKRGSDDPNKLNKNIQKNLLTLDYIFTGKNTDILNFDIKMEMGLAFFQTLVTTDNIPSSYTTATGSTVENSSADGVPPEYSKTSVDRQDRPPNLRSKTPIFFSTKFDNKSLRNTLSPKDSASFQALLNRQAALENLEALVEIHGNPGLMNAMNKLPSEILQHQDINETKANTETDRPDLFPYWETTPAIVQLNIRMPTTESDPPYVNADATKPFWYQGYYYCYGVENIFNEGLFTQKLNLISLPSSSNFDNPKNQQKDKSGSESQKEKEQIETSKTSGSSVSITTTSNKSQQNITKTTAQRAVDTPPLSEGDGDALSVEDYLKAMFKSGRSAC